MRSVIGQSRFWTAGSDTRLWAIAVEIHCRRLAVDGRWSVPNVVLHWKLSLPPVGTRSIYRTDCGRLPIQSLGGLDTQSCEFGSLKGISKAGSVDQRITKYVWTYKRLRVELLFSVSGAAPVMNCRLCKDLPQYVWKRRNLGDLQPKHLWFRVQSNIHGRGPPLVLCNDICSSDHASSRQSESASVGRDHQVYDARPGQCIVIYCYWWAREAYLATRILEVILRRRTSEISGLNCIAPIVDCLRRQDIPG
ncbi:hypothetical protein ASPBRDRAFT_310129 [Aspergillus brasiliensis CBS 101740]|uniref:Uncharacterized protein n=1 Tax=Aspergillus brasiliensis (strain CBS 101740 / IMI 381727 / IBT 21946) TaxID=767769 RepID=A0A1L9UAQ3_ASPBC|nr:hypothetical protein ASPBRDRAFT_310129 [Aspergillus brasiliensis CBS 101740]